MSPASIAWERVPSTKRSLRITTVSSRARSSTVASASAARSSRRRCASGVFAQAGQSKSGRTQPSSWATSRKRRVSSEGENQGHVKLPVPASSLPLISPNAAPGASKGKQGCQTIKPRFGRPVRSLCHRAGSSPCPRLAGAAPLHPRAGSADAWSSPPLPEHAPAPRNPDRTRHHVPARYSARRGAARTRRCRRDRRWRVSTWPRRAALRVEDVAQRTGEAGEHVAAVKGVVLPDVG